MEQSRVIRGRKRFIYQSLADVYFRTAPTTPASVSSTLDTEAAAPIRTRKRFLYPAIADPVYRQEITPPPTPVGGPDRSTISSGSMVARKRFPYAASVMPLLPQPGVTAYDARELGWLATYPTQHLLPKWPVHRLLRPRQETPWDIDIVPTLWEATFPDLVWRRPQEFRSFNVVVLLPPEAADINPSTWLATYPSFLLPRAGLLTASQQAYHWFADTPPSPITVGSWLIPLSLPLGRFMLPSRLHLDAATFDRDLTLPSDPTPVTAGENWRRRLMVSPVGQLVRPILPGP